MIQPRHLPKELNPVGISGWEDYWTFVTATILIMFVLFLAQHGRLSVWLNFFSWSSPQPIANVTGDLQNTSPSTGSSQANPNATPANPTQGSTPFGTLNWFQNFGTFLLHPFSGTK